MHILFRSQVTRTVPKHLLTLMNTQNQLILSLINFWLFEFFDINIFNQRNLK